jgi:hypothetical protein
MAAKELILISITTHLTMPKIGPFGVDLLPRIELLMRFLGRRLLGFAHRPNKSNKQEKIRTVHKLS